MSCLVRSGLVAPHVACLRCIATAYAFDLVAVSDSLNYVHGSENKMHGHLEICFDAEALIPFPKATITKKRGRKAKSRACVCIDNVSTL